MKLMKIFVIEDEAIIRMDIEEKLHSLGYEVVGSASSGEAAIENAVKLRPDLVLMDIKIEGKMDGIEAADHIKQLGIPVVFVTAFVDEETLKRAKVIDPFGYILKPVNERTLRAGIEMAKYKHKLEMERQKAEKALRESEKRLHTVIDGVSAILWAVDKNGAITFSEGRGLELLGLKPGQMVGRSLFDWYPDNEQIITGTHRALTGEDYSSFTEIKGILFENRWSPLLDDKGSVFGAIGVFLDVTEQMKIKMALAESEEKYRELIDNLSDTVIELDSDLNITFVSPQSFSLSGFKPEELLRKNSCEFIHADDCEAVRASMEKAFKAGRNFLTECRLLHKDGHYLYVSGSVRLIQKYGEIKIVGVIRDITERKKAEEALRESEETGRALLNAPTDAVVLIDTHGTILLANETMAERLAKQVGELTGLNFSSLYPTEQTGKNDAYVEQVIRTGEPVRFEDKRLGLWLDNVLYPIPDKYGKVNKIAIISRDITERKQAEEEKDRMRDQLIQAQTTQAIVNLAGGIAHNYNNALVGIAGNIDLLRMNLKNNETVVKYTDSMKMAVNRMVNITNQLVAYAQGGKYQAKNMSVQDFMHNTLPLLQHGIGSDIRVKTNLPEEILYIDADIAQMQMVLNAILVNASEAADGKGNIHIAVKKIMPGQKPVEVNKEGTGPYVSITIEDDGIGMDEETKKRIFEPFFTTKFIGRGLGMAAVYGIIKNHNGWVSVDSGPAKGTRVSIYLPIHEVFLPEPELHEAEVTTGSETILFIEDEEMVMNISRNILEKLGYRVLGAKTGEEAVEIANTFDGDIDLAILDIGLPDIPAHNVYLLIKKARPKMKVVLCSGYTIDGPARDILDAGAQDFIQKPFSVAVMSEKIKNALKG